MSPLQELLRLQEARSEVRCVECGGLAVGPATGWRSFVGGYDGDPVEVLVFCPACIAREFGEEVDGW